MARNMNPRRDVRKSRLVASKLELRSLRRLSRNSLTPALWDGGGRGQPLQPFSQRSASLSFHRPSNAIHYKIAQIARSQTLLNSQRRLFILPQVSHGIVAANSHWRYETLGSSASPDSLFPQHCGAHRPNPAGLCPVWKAVTGTTYGL
jgi:hypothetical protein